MVIRKFWRKLKSTAQSDLQEGVCYPWLDRKQQVVDKELRLKIKLFSENGEPSALIKSGKVVKKWGAERGCSPLRTKEVDKSEQLNQGMYLNHVDWKIENWTYYIEMKEVLQITLNRGIRKLCKRI